MMRSQLGGTFQKCIRRKYCHDCSEQGTFWETFVEQIHRFDISFHQITHKNVEHLKIEISYLKDLEM